MAIQYYNEEDDRFYEVEFARVDNGGHYPGSFTKKEYDWIHQFSTGKVLHLFSGSSLFGDCRVDLSHENATKNADVFEFLEQNSIYYDTILLDPPYNSRFAQRYAILSKSDVSRQFIIFAQAEKTTTFFNHLIRLAPKRIIMKSWNWYVVKGYKVVNSILCYAGGYRKPTLFMVLEKIE
jgi:adenine-specific DNA methylase